MPELRTPQRNVFDALNSLQLSPICPSGHAIERARKIAYLIEREGSPMPFVFPTEIGGVQFEWKGSRRELDLEILPNSERLAFLTIVDGDPVTEGETAEDFEDHVIALLKWMRWR